MQGNPDPEIRKILLVESGIRKYFLLESGILVFGIGNTAQLIRVPLTVGNRNLSSTENESIIQHLESGIHGIESRIQDCLEFPYTERTTAQAVKNIKKNASSGIKSLYVDLVAT